MSVAPFSEDQLRSALDKVLYPGFRRSILSFGLVKEVSIEGGNVNVQLQLSTTETHVPKILKQEIEASLRAIPGVENVTVLIDIQSPVSASSSAPIPIPGVAHVIAVASGKGGVGKSTVAVNLAVALSQLGAAVGLCDCDLYGPSVAFLCGVNKKRPEADDKNQIIPVKAHGIAIMSMGLLLEGDAPAVLRGPMVSRYTQQFLRQVAWGELDYLILDLPPGTGDIQLTIVQTVPVSGAILVTTPQEVALLDVRKAASMFRKTNVPLMGIIENMSYFTSPSDGVRYAVFGTGGGMREAVQLDIPFLGEIPLDSDVRASGDAGVPFLSYTTTNKTSEAAEVLRKAANSIKLKI
jgi:ATP-binding protein involved in chromosome partitioning